MTDYEKFAILISIFAIVVSFLALGWNIYRDIIMKPRLKVRLKISFVKHGEYESESKISIDATNFGPNKIICESIHAKNAPLFKWILRKVEYAYIVHDYNFQYSSKLPCDLDVGRTCNLFLSFDKDCLFAKPFTHIGISDSFGRTHWAPKKDFARAQKKYKEKFGQK